MKKTAAFTLLGIIGLLGGIATGYLFLTSINTSTNYPFLGISILLFGSGNLVQTLLKNDLVDELWLKLFPVTLGNGKRLFAEGAIPAAFTLIESKTSPSGVIFATYKRSGDVKTGSF